MILVSAAAGTIGRHVMHALRDAGAPTRALVHSLAAITQAEFSHAQIIGGDVLNRDVLDRAMDHIEVLVLLSRAQPDQVAIEQHLMAAAQRHGVRRIVKLSSTGASPHASFRVGRWHWQSERLLAATSVDWVVVRTARPMQHVYSQLGSLLGQHTFYGCQGEEASSDVDLRDVAAVLAAVATGDAASGSVLHITGPQALAPQRSAALLGEAMGHPVAYVDCTPGDFVRGQVAGGVPRWQAEDRAAWQTTARSGAFSTIATDLTRVLGRSPRTYASFAAEFASAVRYATAPVARREARSLAER